MADTFCIVELIKYYELDSSKLMIHNSFTYKTKVKTETVLDSYFTTLYGASDDTSKEILNIKGIVVDIGTFYSLQTSITDCEDNEESFYFDIADQMLYIHYNHDISPYSILTEYGKVFGYTSDIVRNFNGIDYLPLVKSVPNFSLKVDPLSYTQQAFYGGDVILNNQPIDGSSNNGTFDSNEEFTGNDIFIYYGEEGDGYTDLLLIANNYIENTIISMDQVIVKTNDKRKQQSAQFPFDTYDDTDFPDIAGELIGKVKQDAYGRIKAVPGVCVNSEQAGNKTFYFASVITSGGGYPIFRALSDGIWNNIVPTATDYANGMATFNTADVHIDGDNTKGLLDVRCEGYFRPYYNPADIIADLNLRVLNITYNSSNYDTTEWVDEKQYLTNVGIFMGDQKDLFEWIELLQSGSTVGFQYLFVEGKRTIRLDNPNRDPVLTIYAEEILNEPEFDNNESFFSTSAVITYQQRYHDDSFLRYENTDYYDEVFREHRKESQFEIDSLLWSEANAEDKSIIIMEDQKKERPIGKLLLYGKSFYELKLFDIINAEISKPGEKTGQEEIDVYIWGDDPGDDVYVWGDGAEDVYVWWDYTIKDIIINYREFLGWMRFQIIGLFPDFKGNLEIEVRQRDYSDEFDSVTGYTP